MTAYDDNNTGVLFVNERKTSDKAPDFTGSVTVDGQKMQLAAWKRASQQGKKFLSLKLTVPSSADKTKTYATQQNEPPPPRDEDIF